MINSNVMKISDPREYCISTKDFVLDDEGKLNGLNTVRVEWTKDSGGRWKMEEVPGSEKFFPAQLVFLALGFLGPQNEVLKALNIKQDARSNVQTPPKVCRLAVSYAFVVDLLFCCRNILPMSKVSSPLVTAVAGSR